MNIKILSRARRDLALLRPYESARSLTLEGRIFLDANEAPESSLDAECEWNRGGLLSQACAEAPNPNPNPKPSATPSLNRYPEPQPRQLLQRFSEIYGVRTQQILIGRGSDEAIDLLVRTFCEAGVDSVLDCPPTYGMYEVSAEIQGARLIRVPLLQQNSGEFLLDVERIIEKIQKEDGLKIIFICSPNNPTGTAFDRKTISEICEAASDRCLVVVDEAYGEFQQGLGMVEGLSKYPNLVILRTLSKAWAGAGVRCGVALAHEEIIRLLSKIRAPYPMSTPSLQAALELTDLWHQLNLRQRTEDLIREREKLKEFFTRLPSVGRVFPSSANFLLVRFFNAPEILKALRERGIIVRDRSRDPGLENCIRITLGTADENASLMEAIRQVRPSNEKSSEGQDV